MGHRSGFSLIELVIVIIIVGLLAAIAVPRFGSASERAGDAKLVTNLRVIRGAIDAFHAEHGGRYPSLAAFEAELTGYTDAKGTVYAARSAAAPFGPYLRELPAYKDGRTTAKVAAAAGNGVDWVYDETTGRIYANAGGAKDREGRPYADY